MKSKKIKFSLGTFVKVLLLIPIIAVIVYAGGYVAQFIYNFTTWQEAGGVAGDGTSPAFPSYEPLDCIKAVFTFPYGLYGIGICIVALVILIVFVMKLGSGDKGEYDRERNMTYSDKGTYGTSGFMTEQEMKEVLELTANVKRNRGTILGQLDGKAVCVPVKSRMNRNIAVYGASGSMKSRAFARNMVLQCVVRGESLIITDPKSELYEDMSEYLRQNGYTVKVFNLVNPENSDSWNCLAEVEGQELMAQLFVDVVIKNTGSGKWDPFWDNSELNLLKAMVLYVDQGYPPEGKNIGQVYKLLSLSSEKELNSLFDGLPIEHPAKAPYSIFKQAAETVRGGIIIGLGSRLQVFQNKLIRLITSYDEIDLTLPGREKCAYFCITSDQDSTFDFLSSLFLSFLFIKLVRYADKHGDSGRLPVPVHLLADELANIGVIPDLTKKISTIRSRGISMSVIFQNLAQMQNRYPLNQWQEIIGNCDVQLFLGCTDEITAKFISDRTGEVTIGVSSQAKQLNTWRVSNYTPEYRETSSIGKRKLLTMDEVLRLPINKALVIIRGHKVLKVDKYDYTLHPDAKKLKPSKASAHVPEWYAKGNDAETEYSPFDKPANPTQNKKPAAQDKKQKEQKNSVPKPPPVSDDKNSKDRKSENVPKPPSVAEDKNEKLEKVPTLPPVADDKNNNNEKPETAPNPPPVAEDNSNNDEKLDKAPESPVSTKEKPPVIPDTENNSVTSSENSEHSDELNIVKTDKDLIMSKKT